MLQVFRLGSGAAQGAALLALSRAHPCCCLPPDIIHQQLFERVVEEQLFLDVLDVVFHHTGFALGVSDVHQKPCSICRNNGGVELERCMRMGVYSSSQSLSQSSWNANPQLDPWRSFDFYADYVMERIEQPFSLSIVKLLARIVPDATSQVLSLISSISSSSSSSSSSISSSSIDSGSCCSSSSCTNSSISSISSIVSSISSKLK